MTAVGAGTPIQKLAVTHDPQSTPASKNSLSVIQGGALKRHGLQLPLENRICARLPVPRPSRRWVLKWKNVSLCICAYNHVVFLRDVLSTWRQVLLTMLARKARARHVVDFRPSASVRVLIIENVVILFSGRIEDVLGQPQPEGFRQQQQPNLEIAEFDARTGADVQPSGTSMCLQGVCRMPSSLDVSYVSWWWPNRHDSTASKDFNLNTMDTCLFVKADEAFRVAISAFEHPVRHRLEQRGCSKSGARED